MARATFSWPKKLLLGCALAGILAALGLVGFELALRVAGVGHAPGFWRTEKTAAGETIIRENWWVTVPYFAPELLRRPQPFRLPKEKAANAYRIFVLGSSAAMGDPEPSFSIARVLETLLQAAYPEMRIEVINAGVTAINSHVVRGIAADCAKLQPDLFVVYEGNNEVIGPFGPATVFTAQLRHPTAIRSSILLRGTRFGQWLGQKARRQSGENETLEEWGGMAMFLEHEIAADDPRLDSTVELFGGNLRAIVESGRRAGAIVALATVLTNQRDFAPFQSRHSPALTADALAAFERAFSAGVAAAAQQDWTTAERHFQSAVTADADFAEAHFRLGQVLLSAGKSAAAKEAFQRALDRDVLRFRTDSRLNQRIREVAAESGEGVVLVDLEKAAAAEAQHGIIGDEFLYEHVHLSFRGTYLAARELFRVASADLERRRGQGATVNAPRTMLEMDAVRERLAFTTYEQAMIVKEMLARLSRAPFTGQSNNSLRLAAFQKRDARAAQLLSHSQSADAFAEIYERAIAARPQDWILQRNYGMAMAALGRPERAKEHLLGALETIPDDPDTIYALSVALRQLGETEAENTRLSQLRELAPRHPGLEKR